MRSDCHASALRHEEARVGSGLHEVHALEPLFQLHEKTCGSLFAAVDDSLQLEGFVGRQLDREALGLRDMDDGAFLEVPVHECSADVGTVDVYVGACCAEMCGVREEHANGYRLQSRRLPQ